MISPRRPIAILALAVVALAFVGAFAADARADTAAEIQRKLEAARDKIADAEKKKESLGEQISNLDGRLAAIQKKLEDRKSVG